MTTISSILHPIVFLSPPALLVILLSWELTFRKRFNPHPVFFFRSMTYFFESGLAIKQATKRVVVEDEGASKTHIPVFVLAPANVAYPPRRGVNQHRKVMTSLLRLCFKQEKSILFVFLYLFNGLYWITLGKYMIFSKSHFPQIWMGLGPKQCYVPT